MSQEKTESTENNQITLKVVDPQGGETVFRIRKTTKFTKLFKVYCERKGYQIGSIKFTFDGILIDEDQTPDELDMEDEDIIEAHLRQVGGF